LAEILAVLTTIWGLVMALAPLLQLRVIIKTRDASGTSATWIGILLIGFLLWLAYGLVNHALPVIIANAASAVIAVVLLVTIAVYRSKSVPASVEAADRP
jgi:MtN3 and saliva related transmembrane protein